MHFRFVAQAQQQSPHLKQHLSLLHALDSASFSWFHVKARRDTRAPGRIVVPEEQLSAFASKSAASDAPAPPPQAIIVAGMGFFADAYDLFRRAHAARAPAALRARAARGFCGG